MIFLFILALKFGIIFVVEKGVQMKSKNKKDCIILTKKETEVLNKDLKNPPEPNDALIKLMHDE